MINFPQPKFVKHIDRIMVYRGISLIYVVLNNVVLREGNGQRDRPKQANKTKYPNLHLFLLYAHTQFNIPH